jgi:hypothetical protein
MNDTAQMRFYFMENIKFEVKLMQIYNEKHIATSVNKFLQQ